MNCTLTPMDREELLLAPYAMRSQQSAGRQYPESTHPYRTIFQRDRDRITHCAAFRRLSQKTQVFTGDSGDYHRTRLTHTLEVASIARTIARALRLNEDLVEALALLHDIGHPPFGHAGEDLLDERLAGEGGFNHNAQALRIVKRIEQRYPNFPGLNLSQEVLSGQQRRGSSRKAISEPPQPLLEVQIVDAADSIAYDAHDADDALELGLLTMNDMAELELWREATQVVESRYSNLEPLQLRRAIIHQLIDQGVGMLIETTLARLEDWQITSVEQVQASPSLVTMPEEFAERKLCMQQFLFSRVYRHPDLLRQRELSTAELGVLFDYYVDHGNELPTFYQTIAEEEGLPRAVGDYLSTQTDRSAREAYQSL
ncbi:dGTP triphosphohydrolase [Aeoliella mucimassa]|uniref:Deoxyguanosinetriphosphate triphosphohydrolase-like protein n=1 Tax=Aeoliella mucimassa TaxID=2527972 RepID=A0A518AVS3_9BACT|nr:dNTP triphosphohydrolase [Aeoliella mucimassa]QDU58826.1 Deoxyguanosinetriphosphate triphosphohydrolase [Aeoliella mucimassa]